MRHPLVDQAGWQPIAHDRVPDLWWRSQVEVHLAAAAERRARAGLCMANAAASPARGLLTGWIVRFWCDAGRRALRAAVRQTAAARDLELVYGGPPGPAALRPPPDFV